ncbi:MAG: hypothetical protein RIA69_16975 [Cyclobacteriaceae bacterium]
MTVGFNKQYFLFLLILLNGHFLSWAQEDKTGNFPYIPEKSWEVGTDLLWLIDKNTLPANNLLVRRNYTTEYSVRHAWRLRMGVNLSRRDSLTIFDFLNELNTTYLMIRMGHEWQFPVEDKALLYFGGDLQFAYTKIDEKRLNASITSYFFDIQDRIYEPGLSIVLGARYFIKPWMSVNLESEIGLRYRIRRYDEVDSPLDFPGSGGFSFVDSETFLLNLSPIHSMNLSFHF